jgi:hypothetical protein
MVVAAVFLTTGCTSRPTVDPRRAITGDIRVVLPFKRTEEGRLYLSDGKLRVESGGNTVVYIAKRSSGWRIFPKSKSYLNIGEPQVSTYLPHLTNGSPCPTAENPSQCRIIGKEKLFGRPATKWKLVTQEATCIAHLWTDDELHLALRWEIENSLGTATYELKKIRNVSVTESMFQLPEGFAPAPGSSARGHGFAQELLRADQRDGLAYELYSWKDASGWSFSVLPNTDRQKTTAEVFNPAKALRDVDELKSIISGMPAGSQIVWFDRLTLGGVRIQGSESLRYPPENVISEITSYTQARGMKVHGPLAQLLP